MTHGIRLVHCLSPSRQTLSQIKYKPDNISELAYETRPSAKQEMPENAAFCPLLLHGAMTTSASGPALEKCLNNTDLIWCDQ